MKRKSIPFRSPEKAIRIWASQTLPDIEQSHSFNLFTTKLQLHFEKKLTGLYQQFKSMNTSKSLPKRNDIEAVHAQATSLSFDITYLAHKFDPASFDAKSFKALLSRINWHVARIGAYIKRKFPVKKPQARHRSKPNTISCMDIAMFAVKNEKN